MENKRRLIDADEFLESIEGMDWYSIRYNGEASQGAPSEEVAWYKATDIYSVIDKCPTVDAVEVVRCKDCKSSRKLNNNESLYLVDECLICTNCEATDHGWNPVFPTHFCSYGERRTNERKAD